MAWWTHTHTLTHTQNMQVAKHRICKSMMTKNDFKTSKPQSMSKGAFLMGGIKMWRLPKEKRWLASCEQNKLEIVVYDTLDWMEKKFVWVNLELGNKDVFVITSYCNLCDRCTVGWNDMNSPSTPHINPPHPFHPPYSRVPLPSLIRSLTHSLLSAWYS